MILLLFSGSGATAVVVIDTTLPALRSALEIGINPLEWLVDAGGGWSVSDSGEWPVEVGAGWGVTSSDEWPVDPGAGWE